MSRKRWSLEQIEDIVKQAKELGLSYKEAAQQFGIPLWRIYLFNYESNRTKKSDPNETDQPKDIVTNSLSDIVKDNQSDSIKEDKESEQNLASSDCQTAKKSLLPDQVRDIIIDYKRQNPYYGFKRIEQYLREKYFLVIPRKQIRQVLKEADLLGLNDSSFDRQDDSALELKGTRRFEADRPGELYQMDITYVYITGLKVLYLINVMDDHSRFCLCSVLRFDQCAETLIDVLHDAISEYGNPKKLLTDEGRAFYSWSGEKTKFQQYLDEQQIEHIVADPHSPTTTGKIERFNQTIKNELIRKVKFKDYADAVEKIKGFIRYYNYERPHQGLDGARPADRFMGINANKVLAQNKLVEKELDFGKGYLIFKLGTHEVSIIIKPGEAPEIFVNGNLYIAKNS